eukprot:gene23940-10069_t
MERQGHEVGVSGAAQGPQWNKLLKKLSSSLCRINKPERSDQSCQLQIEGMVIICRNELKLKLLIRLPINT